jgi:predicted nucleic acid-binding protein
MDLLIAATAHAHSARLYTRNAHDLSGLEDLVEIVSVPSSSAKATESLRGPKAR